MGKWRKMKTTNRHDQYFQKKSITSYSVLFFIIRIEYRFRLLLHKSVYKNLSMQQGLQQYGVEEFRLHFSILQGNTIGFDDSTLSFDNH